MVQFAISAVTAAVPSVLAGMPGLTFTDAARLRLQGLSFFLLGLLASAWVVRRLWNDLQADFPRLPKLSYPRAMAVVLLWGLLFMVVLTMISGARELMTPGAWVKEGLTYKLAGDQDITTDRESQFDVALNEQRRWNLERLQLDLWNRHEENSGEFPVDVESSGVPLERWQLPRRMGARYIYVAGLGRDDPLQPLVYEPDVYDDGRFILMTDGSIRRTDSEQLARLLVKDVHP